MLETLNDWTTMLDNQSQVDVIYLDFAKAFDKIPHDILLNKLIALRLNEHLIRWLNDFLTDRTFQVKVGSEICRFRSAPCGVPQGAVLSPVLFGIFVNELSSLLPENVHCKQFADDTKLYASVNNKTVENSLQKGIDIIVEWSKSSKLPLNNAKTVAVTVGKVRKETEYSIDGQTIKKENLTRDLGFLISNKLDFTEHWRKTTNTAKFLTAQIFNQYNSKKIRLMVLLYKTFIRPVLEYGTSISSPLKVSDEKLIESVQNSFTRRLYSRHTGKYLRPNDPGYKTSIERNQLYGLSSLKDRRLQIDKKLIEKMMSGKIDLNTADFFTLSQNNRTRAKTRFVWKRPKNKLRRKFFVNRTLTYLTQLNSTSNAPQRNLV
ncbi:hypothetical protein CRE_17535 [Caenorhabditis remanei]|uniref:Reverse transcriptase domain-containing protein n=1 Tax=Caenorhabditis remanei TaxID=31234 RepID=E3NC01_CAERE|nr:hypothetical protein CRE_17535 [Caenorhabditis remanei]